MECHAIWVKNAPREFQNFMNLFLLTLDQSFYLIPLANMIQNIKELLSPNAQLKIFFLRPNGGITLGKEDDFLIHLFLRLTIILIIRKLGITPSSFRITVINVLGFLHLIRFMQSKTCLYGLMSGGIFLELKLVFCILPFAINF
jgi:hypothetical protein